jgi:phage gp29-like protein
MSKDIYITPTKKVRIGDVKKTLSKEVASRDRALSMSSYMGYLPNPDPILKQQGKDISIYEELRTDPHVISQIGSRKAGIRSMKWEIDRGKSKSKQAEFIEDIFKNILKMPKIISQILEAPLYGYKFMEIMWEKRGEYIVPTDVVGKPCEWFCFDTDNMPRFRTKGDINGELLPSMKFLMPTHDADYKNPYGFPLLSACFWSVVFKRGGLKFWSVFTEKYSMPFIIGKTPRGTNTQENNDLLDMLDEMIQDAVAVIPDDSSVEIITGSDKGSSDIYEKLCKYCNADISKALLGQTLTTEVGDKGSYAAGKVHEGVRSDLIESDAEMVADEFNNLIRMLIDINFGSAGKDYPQIVFYYPEDVDKDLAERDQILSNTGVAFSKKYFMKAYGFEEEDIEIKQSEDKKASSGESKFSESQTRDILDQGYADISTKANADSQEEILNWLHLIFDDSTDYDTAISSLLEAYPDVSFDQLQALLADVQTNAYIVGHAEAEDEHV